jgi:hypothetical protein
VRPAEAGQGAGVSVQRHVKKKEVTELIDDELDWGKTFYYISREFGWTPEQIDRLTYQQLIHYIEEINERRETVTEAEISLVMIRKALFAFVGVPEPKPARDKVSDGLRRIGSVPKTNMKAFRMNGKQIAAWGAAGYPPIGDWLKRKKENG